MKKITKLLTVLLAAGLALGFASCNLNSEDDYDTVTDYLALKANAESSNPVVATYVNGLGTGQVTYTFYADNTVTSSDGNSGSYVGNIIQYNYNTDIKKLASGNTTAKVTFNVEKKDIKNATYRFKTDSLQLELWEDKDDDPAKKYTLQRSGI